MWIFFQKIWNWRNWILSVPRVTVCREKKSPWLCQYQSYICNWYDNGKVFTSTTTWEPKNLIFFFKKVWNWIWLVLKSLNQHSSSTCTYMSTSEMHRRPFEGRHLVFILNLPCYTSMDLYQRALQTNGKFFWIRFRIFGRKPNFFKWILHEWQYSTLFLS